MFRTIHLKGVYLRRGVPVSLSFSEDWRPYRMRKDEETPDSGPFYIEAVYDSIVAHPKAQGCECYPIHRFMTQWA